MPKFPIHAVILAVGLLAFLGGCVTATNYQNEKTDTAATIVPYRARVPMVLSVTEAEVSSIDGQAVEMANGSPVYLSPGAHDVTFRFRVPGAPKEVVHHRVQLTVEDNAVFQIRARYLRYAEPAPSIDFSLIKDGDSIYHASVTF